MTARPSSGDEEKRSATPQPSRSEGPRPPSPPGSRAAGVAVSLRRQGRAAAPALRRRGIGCRGAPRSSLRRAEQAWGGARRGRGLPRRIGLRLSAENSGGHEDRVLRTPAQSTPVLSCRRSVLCRTVKRKRVRFAPKSSRMLRYSRSLPRLPPVNLRTFGRGRPARRLKVRVDAFIDCGR